jgi:uncharacterized protein YjbJ (UPF0337 family)
MNEDQVRGRIEEAKGKVKEVAGNAAGKKDMERKGKATKIRGKVRAAYGDVKEEIKKNI